MAYTYTHPDILRRKKKCMFGKDEKPEEVQQFFSGWLSEHDSGTTWTTTDAEDMPEWTHVTHVVRLEYD